MSLFRNLVSLCLVFTSSLLSAQNLELSAGAVNNNFRDPFGEKAPRKKTIYTPDWGYSLQFSIDDVQVDWLKMRFTLGYSYLGGAVDASDGGMAGSGGIDAEFNKSLLTLAVYPAHLDIDGLEIDLGVEIGRLLKEEFSGTRYSYLQGRAPIFTEVSDQNYELNAKNYLGLSLRIALDIKLTESWILSPQYCFYYGVSPEFVVNPATSRSYHHYLAIGIQRTLKKD